MNLKQFLPFLQWLPTYNKSLFQMDLSAGLTVGVMLVPQGMAYALLAGMPPIYGLYGGLIPLLLYALLGTSRQLSIGPVAVSALLVLGGIQQLAEPMTEKYISLVILTGLLVGLLQVTMSFLRLGFLVNFLSHPVVAGFSSAAAIIIGVSQLKYLLGFEIPRFSNLLDTVSYALTHLTETHLLTTAFCVGGIVLMLLLRRISRSIPDALITVILGILIVRFLQLDEQGIDVVREVPEGLPSFILPHWTLDNMRAVMPTVLTVAIIGIVESLSIAKVLEAKNRDYKVEANQELLALGLSKIGGSFFQALPTSGSFTRSAINNESGAKTGMASIITVLLIALTLVFLTPLFYYLPTAILAAIVLLAVKSLFEYKEAIYLWKTHRSDFFMMLVTVLITLVNIEIGVLVGVILSVMMVLYNSSKPHVAILGKLPDSTYYRNVSRFPDAVQLEDGIILRFDAQLFFGNTLYFKDTLFELIEQKKGKLKVFILDASSIYSIDSTGLHALNEVQEVLAQNGIIFFISGAIGPLRDGLYKSGLMERIGIENQFMTVNNAVETYQKRKHRMGEDWTDSAVQTNVG